MSVEIYANERDEPFAVVREVIIRTASGIENRYEDAEVRIYSEGIPVFSRRGMPYPAISVWDRAIRDRFIYPLENADKFYMTVYIKRYGITILIDLKYNQESR